MKLCDGVVYTSDTAGVSIASPATGSKHFLNYPEAAIWCVLAENRNKGTEIRKISIILGKEEKESSELVQNCLENWKSLNLIY